MGGQGLLQNEVLSEIGLVSYTASWARDKLIERANVAHCSGGFAEAVQLRRRYAVMKEAARARRR